jgi:hypothetical protein
MDYRQRLGTCHIPEGQFTMTVKEVKTEQHIRIGSRLILKEGMRERVLLSVILQLRGNHTSAKNDVASQNHMPRLPTGVKDAEAP